MATLASDLIESTRRHLFTGAPEQLNKLSGSLTSSATTFNLTYSLGGIQAGTVVAIDLEEIFVWAVNSTSMSVTDCTRGYNGTTAAAHASAAIVTVQPKFSQFRIFQALNDELLDLSSPQNGLYQIKTVDITFNPTRYGYDLTGVSDLVDVAEVRFRTAGPEKTWPKIMSWSLERNMPSTGTYGDFASGNALMIYRGAFPGLPIHVRYKAPFAALTGLTNDVTAVSGLPATAIDIPPLGAAIRLVLGREIHR